MSHDSEKYCVEWERGGEGGEAVVDFGPLQGHRPSTLHEARVLAKRLREQHTALGTVVQIGHASGPAEGQAVEYWERVRRSQKHLDGWEYTRR